MNWLLSRSPGVLMMVCVVALAGCGPGPASALPFVDMNKRVPLPVVAAAGITHLRVGVAAIPSPQGTVESYGALTAYLAKHLGRPVDLVQRRTYAELNDMVKENQVELAFICTNAYVVGNEQFGMELLLAPEINGESVYFIEELVGRGVSVASDLASRSTDPILLNDSYRLHELLRETASNHPDALYAFVLDSDNQVIAHTFGETGFPTDLLNPTLAVAAPALYGTIRHWVYASNEGRVHEMVAPIMGGSAGVVRLGLTEARLQAVVNVVNGQMILTTLLVALAGIVAAMLLTWLLTRPILDLVAATKEVGRGDLRARAPHWADDEIGTLADAFNQMVADLDASQRTAAEKEQARFLLLKKLISAQEEERKRIARELHDGVGQMLTSLMVGMRTLQRSDNADLITYRMDELCTTVGETLEQVRTHSRELRPSLLDDLGLAAALERYAAQFARAHPTARDVAPRFVPEARSRWEAMLLGYQRMARSKLFVWQPVILTTPASAIISRAGHRVICDHCCEEILNEREVVLGETTLCRHCAHGGYYELCEDPTVATLPVSAGALA